MQGDIVKIRSDAMKNDKIKPMAENVKEQIKNAMETDLNLRVSTKNRVYEWRLIKEYQFCIPLFIISNFE